MGALRTRVEAGPCLSSSSPPSASPRPVALLAFPPETPSVLLRLVLTSTMVVRAATGTRPSAPATPPAPAPRATLLTALLHRQMLQAEARGHLLDGRLHPVPG